MKDLLLSEIELQQRIASFRTRKFAATNDTRTNRSERVDHGHAAPSLKWRQYAL